MIFNGKKITGDIHKNCLYRIEQDNVTAVTFQEKQGDTVYIKYKMEDNQYGLYGEEYKPEFLNKEGHKVIDIFL